MGRKREYKRVKKELMTEFHYLEEMITAIKYSDWIELVADAQGSAAKLEERLESVYGVVLPGYMVDLMIKQYELYNLWKTKGDYTGTLPVVEETKEETIPEVTEPVASESALPELSEVLEESGVKDEQQQSSNKTKEFGGADELEDLFK